MTNGLFYLITIDKNSNYGIIIETNIANNQIV